MPGDARGRRRRVRPGASSSIDWSRLYAITGIITFSSNVLPSPRAGERDRRVVADHLGRDHQRHLAHHRVDLARHDRAARLRRGDADLADAAPRAAGEPADVVGDLA